MRSLLFIPAHDARKLEKGLGCGADALIVDLEDAVPEALKPSARAECAAFVREHAGAIRILVRVNGLTTGHTQADLEAVIGARPYGIILPKSETGHDVAELGSMISKIEVKHGIPENTTRILPIVTETAAGVLGIGTYAQAAGARLCGMMWGGEDLAADIGAISNRGQDGRYLPAYELARALMLLGATASQVIAVDAVYTNFRDSEGLRAEAAQAVRDGFSAKAAIHPDQIVTINEAFTPVETEVAWARRVIGAFEAQPHAGAIAIDGKMLDRPHYRAALRVLDRAGPSG